MQLFLKEYKKYDNEKVKVPSSYSDVYIGKNIVKKIPKRGAKKYEKKQVQQAELMADNSDIFPSTKIFYKSGEAVLILQKKVDTQKAKTLYNEIGEVLGGADMFLTVLEEVSKYGISEKKFFEKYKPYFKDDDVLFYWFKKFIEVANRLSQINEIEMPFADLHDENFGIENGVNLKIIDF